jgi:hydrogenase-4 component F
MEASTSYVLLLLFAIPAFGSLIVYSIGKKSGYSREGITIICVILNLLISIFLNFKTFTSGSQNPIYTIFCKNIFIDGFGAFMALLINLILIVILLYSFTYMKSYVDSGKLEDSRLRLFYTLILAFDATMMLTVTANHLILLYISVEASTLATAFLVGFFKDKKGLEAAFKYILLVVLGIAFALMGCVLLYASVVPHITAHNALLLTDMGQVASQIPKMIAIVAAACFIIGFGAKGGLLPFHPWLPDAHAEAPTPVSALLSGLVIKVGAYAFVRTFTILAPQYKGLILFITGLSCVSMFLGIILAYSQDDIKRLLAFSSISQISYVFCAFGLGSYVGVYAGIFHLMNHALLKCLLFLSVGSIMYATGSRKISRLKGLYEKMPITSVCFFVGALGISGMPLFNGFHSKFAIFVALAQKGLWWALGIAVGTGILTLGIFVWTGIRVFWGHPDHPHIEKTLENTQEVPFAMWAPLAIIAAIIIIIGIFPQILYPLLNSATMSIINTIQGVAI